MALATASNGVMLVDLALRQVVALPPQLAKQLPARLRSMPGAVCGVSFRPDSQAVFSAECPEFLTQNCSSHVEVLLSGLFCSTQRCNEDARVRRLTARCCLAEHCSDCGHPK